MRALKNVKYRGIRDVKLWLLKAPTAIANGRKSRAWFSWKEFANLRDVEFIVVQVCDYRGSLLKNFLKSSFVSDELGQRRSERGPFRRIVADPAATSVLSRRIIGLRSKLLFAVLRCTSFVARESSASSSFRNTRVSSRMITTHRDSRYCRCHSISSFERVLISAGRARRTSSPPSSAILVSTKAIAPGLSQSV